jgi:sporulation protein YtfJ
MERNPIHGLMDTAMESIRDMVDVNTVLGDAIVAQDGSTVVPVSKVSFGFVAGGGEYSSEKANSSYPFAGGAGGGVTIQPVGFLVCGDNHVRMLPAQSKYAVDRVIDLIPGLMEELKCALERANTKRESSDGKERPRKKSAPPSVPPEGPLPEVPAE